ncbi:MAG: hypothetical protein WCO52_04865 [bacterium]
MPTFFQTEKRAIFYLEKPYEGDLFEALRMARTSLALSEGVIEIGTMDNVDTVFVVYLPKLISEGEVLEWATDSLGVGTLMKTRSLSAL